MAGESEDQSIPGLPERYVVHRVVGAGGMGEVFEATDTAHGRRVAIKMIRRRTATEQWTARFLREIQAVARLNHPNIVPLFESGVAAERPYFVMPLLDSPTLRQVLNREGPLPIERAMDITAQIGSALAHAHTHGIIHRDVKPENVAFSSGVPVLTDFGLAGGEQFKEGLTDPEMGIGTPNYASPEQLTGSLRPAPGTDIYALGCLVYEMLTGEPPYTGRTIEALLGKKVSGEIPSARTLRPAVPRHVDRAIRKALAPTRADRFASVAAFLQACKAAPRPMLTWRLVAALALAAGIGAAAWTLARPGPGFRTLAVVTETDAEWLQVLAARTRRQLSMLHDLRVLDEDTPRYPPGDPDPNAEVKVFLSVGRGPSGDRLLVRGVSAGRKGMTWKREYEVPSILVQHLGLPARIAEDLVGALGLAVTADELTRLQQVPTANPEAWRLYQVASRLFGSSDRGADNLQAARMFEAAAASDTTFAEAFAKAGEALAVAYRRIRDSSLLAEAQGNVERALALSPGLPEAYLAAGMIHYVQGRFPQAQTLFATAQHTRPSYQQVEWLQAGILRRQGRWAQALESYEDMVATYPGHRVAALGLGRTLLRLRRYRDAITTLDDAIALGPSARDAPYLDKAWALVLAGEPPASVDLVLAEAEMVTGQSETIERLSEQHPTRGWFWFLGDEWERKLERHRATLEPSNRGAWYLARASALRARNDTSGSRAYADSATVLLNAQLNDRIRDPALLGVLGLAYAIAGKPAEAVLWAQSGTDLRPVALDAYDGPDSQYMLAQVLAITGNQVGARVYIDSITRLPSQYSRRLFERVPFKEPR